MGQKKAPPSLEPGDFHATVVDDRVVLVGELSAHNLPKFRQLLSELPRPLRLDLTRVSFIDSAALGEIYRSYKCDDRLTIVSASVVVRRALDVTGVGLLMDAYPPFTYHPG